VSDSDANIVISAESVRQKADEVAELERKAAKGREELQLLVNYLRFIGRDDWVPSNLVILSREENSFQPLRNEPGTWTGETMRVLASAPNGVSLTAIRDALAKGELAERLKNNPNGFYNGVSRLESNGDAVRYKGMVFSKANYDAFMARLARGEVEDLSGEDERRTVADVLVEYIEKYSGGVATKQIVQDMVALGVVPSAASVYNVLSKIVRAERVRRDKGIYFPLNEMDRPQTTESGPETGQRANAD